MYQTAKVGVTTNLVNAPRVSVGRYAFEPETIKFSQRIPCSSQELYLYDSLIKDIKTYGFTSTFNLGEENLYPSVAYLGIHASYSYDCAVSNFMTDSITPRVVNTPAFTMLRGIRSASSSGLIVPITLTVEPYRLVTGQVMVDSVNGGATTWGCGAVDNVNRGVRMNYASTTTVQAKESAIYTSASYSAIPRHCVGWMSSTATTATAEGFINGTSIGTTASTGNNRGVSFLGVCAQYDNVTLGGQLENFFTAGNLGITYCVSDATGYSASGMHYCMQQYFAKIGITLS